MGSLSPLHWLLVLLVILLLFGTNRLSSVMGDFAKGIKSFKKNMADDTDESMEAHEARKPIAAPGVTVGAPIGVPPQTESIHKV